MMRNIEIKAKVQDWSKLIKRAKELSNTEGEIIQQHDTFYNVPKGKMKLRKFKSNDGELIYYERPDADGPKLSSYEKVSLKNDTVESLNSLLSRALGTLADVKKTRYLFMVNQTRIHADQVDGLGNFMELEVVLRPDQTVLDGEKIAHSLMKELGVQEKDLIPCAYMDLLNK